MKGKPKRPYPRFQQDFSGESLTQQHFAPECDVNNIVARYEATGLDPYADRKAYEQYGDGTYRTYVDAMFAVAEISSKFHELPAHVRDQFQNDPQNWITALHEAENAPPQPEAPEPPQNVSESLSEPPTEAPPDA